jgi:stress-induced morphogen
VSVQSRRKVDKSASAIYRAIRTAFPDQREAIEDVVYRRDPYSIRVRVVSDRFEGKTTRERERLVFKALKDHQIDERDLFNITMLLMRTPQEEQEIDLNDAEFFDPTPSRL